MTAYALGFVVACFVGMFVAGLITDWADRRHTQRIQAARRDATARSLAHLTDEEAMRQVAAAATARARREESIANQRQAAPWFGESA